MERQRHPGRVRLPELNEGIYHFEQTADPGSSFSLGGKTPVSALTRPSPHRGRNLEDVEDARVAQHGADVVLPAHLSHEAGVADLQVAVASIGDAMHVYFKRAEFILLPAALVQ